MLSTTAIAVLATGAFAGAAAANDVKPWKVKTVNGNVMVKVPGGIWKPATVGETLGAGASIKTGDSGRAVLDHKGDVVEASPDSQATFPERLTKMMPSVVQDKGTLLYRIVTRPVDRFNVKTPYLTAVIKGTVFSVTVNGEGGALHVTRGAVEVTSRMTSEAVLVRPGQTAAVSKKPGIRMKLLGKQASRGDGTSVRSAKAQRAADKLDSKSFGNAKGNGLKRAVHLAKFDVFETSRGLVRGPDFVNGKNVGSDRGNSDGPNGKAKGRRAAADASFNLPSVSRFDIAQINGVGNGGGNGNGNGGGNGNGNGGGNGNGNGGGNGNGNANGKKK